MNTTRLEALSDGVIAITITNVVLEVEPPEAATLEAFELENFRLDLTDISVCDT